MAFTASTKSLRADFVMSVILSILGFIVLGTMYKKSYWQVFPDKSVCLLLGNPRTVTFHSSACNFTVFIGFMIAAGGLVLLAMDFVTWKHSERFKGKRTSVAALLVSSIMSFLALSTAIVIGVGIRDFCNHYDIQGVPNPDRCHTDIVNMSSLNAGVSAATLAGFLFAFYGFSEYSQYRRRHTQSDNWYTTPSEQDACVL
ncbi:hypothetical protein EDD21DRAFT_368338 [Dissophora ornata]|nr:hypothetical protein EDD21DRAFT_368338 [Dissophora ornata]